MQLADICVCVCVAVTPTSRRRNCCEISCRLQVVTGRPACRLVVQSRWKVVNGRRSRAVSVSDLSGLPGVLSLIALSETLALRCLCVPTHMSVCLSVPLCKKCRWLAIFC
jgi:hypothetical protein